MAEIGDLPAANVASSEESSYMIKVDGYSRIKAQTERGWFMESTPFSVGGHDWVVRYFPNGCQTEKYEAGFISVFLALNSAASKNVRASAAFSLLGKHRGSVGSYNKTAEHIFPSKGADFGFSNFVKAADLEGSSVYLPKDGLRIICDVTVIKYGQKGNRLTLVPPSNLHQHLGDLLKSTDGADVTFHVAGESFLAHRAVLAARSSLFRAEFFGATKEDAGRPIEIGDMEPDVFKALLHFIYTDSPPVRMMTNGGEARRDAAMAGHLVAADRYNIERLKLICEEKLCNIIDSDIVATSLALAEQHGFHRLKEACFQFLTTLSNLEAMMASEGYEHLKNSCPSVLKELAVSFLPAELKAIKDIIMTT